MFTPHQPVEALIYNLAGRDNTDKRNEYEIKEPPPHRAALVS